MDTNAGARLDIIELSARYARALDHDLDLWDDVFTVDALLDFPTSGEQKVLTPGEMKQHLALMRDGGMTSQHLLSNVLLEYVDSESATGHAEARVLACVPLATKGEIEVTDRIAHYDDEYRRTGEGWRIARRRANVRWTERHVVSAPQ